MHPWYNWMTTVDEKENDEKYLTWRSHLNTAATRIPVPVNSEYEPTMSTEIWSAPPAAASSTVPSLLRLPLSRPGFKYIRSGRLHASHLYLTEHDIDSSEEGRTSPFEPSSEDQEKSQVRHQEQNSNFQVLVWIVCEVIIGEGETESTDQVVYIKVLCCSDRLLKVRRRRLSI